MDNPHFQRSILSCLKSLNFAAVRLQAEQVDESVGALAVEGEWIDVILRMAFSVFSNDKNENYDTIQSAREFARNREQLEVCS